MAGMTVLPVRTCWSEEARPPRRESEKRRFDVALPRNEPNRTGSLRHLPKPRCKDSSKESLRRGSRGGCGWRVCGGRDGSVVFGRVQHFFGVGPERASGPSHFGGGAGEPRHGTLHDDAV